MVGTLISFLAGIVLGQRFKAIVLIPASALAIIGTVTGSLLTSSGPWVSIGAAFSSWCFLQIGYFVGLVLRPILAGGTGIRERTRPLSRSTANERAAL